MEEHCADCGGIDIEWMYKCQKHGLEYCRGCSCPECDEEYEDDYPEQKEANDQLTQVQNVKGNRYDITRLSA